MATLSSPTLTISDSAKPGHSTVKVEYEITFDSFETRFDWPFDETVTLIGDDTAVGDPTSAAPDEQLVTISNAEVRAGLIAAPATRLRRSHTRLVNNISLNEDRADAPDRDEIRAVVVLTPRMPVKAAREGNLVTRAFA